MKYNMENNLEIVTNIKTNLGESPVLDPKNKLLYWIDILEKKIFFIIQEQKLLKK